MAKVQVIIRRTQLAISQPRYQLIIRPAATINTGSGSGGGGGLTDWGDVQNKPTAFPPSAHTHAVSDVTGLQDALDAKQDALGFTPEDAAQKGVAGGYASLDGGGKVPAAQLPSFVDDVIEAANFAALPVTGEAGKIYVALDTDNVYRWSGSTYVEIAASPGSTDAVTEGSVNKYFTTVRVLATTLTGFVVAGARTAVVAADTVVEAFGKIQKALNDLTNVAFSGSASDLTAGTLPAARFDDTAHGSRAGGALHVNVVAAGAAGFMTGADKTKLDAITGTNTGDVTLAGTPNYLTIVGQVITRALIDLASHVTGKLPFANIADMANGTLFYRKTAGAGAPETQTLATLKTDLGLTGTNSGDQTITLTGMVTGSGTGSFATSLGSFTKAQLDAAVSDGNVLYVGDVTTNATHTGDATGATALTLATVNANVGSFGSATQVATFTVDGKGRTTAAGNTTIAIASTAITDFNSAARAQVEAELIAGTNVTITPGSSGATRTLTIAASGGGGGGGISDGDKGDITVSGSGATWTIDNAVVTNAKLADMPTARFKGRTTAGTGEPEDLTAAQATALLDTFVASGGSHKKGLVPDPPASSGTAKFLREDATWAQVTESIIVAASDETTALTTGSAKVTFRMPYAFTLTAVRASLTTAQTSGTIFTVDINEAGTTVLSTKLTIDNTEKTSTTAATAAVISDTALADDAEITIDIDQIGDGTAKGLKVYLIGYQS